MLKLLNHNHILALVCICFFNICFSQTKEQKKDSTEAVYQRIEAYSEKTKTAKFLHRLIFRTKREPKNKIVVKPKQIYRTFEDKIIRHIKVNSHDPFGFSFRDSTKKANKWIERTGNKLHTRSKDFAIKNFLIFKENSPLDSLKIIESERLIRAQNFIRGVEITVKPIEKSRDSVDILITTLDSWSLIPRGSISDSKIKLQLREQNFLGFGHQLRIGTQNRFNDGERANSMLYRIPNFKNTYVNSTLSYSKSLDGSYRKYFDIGRPFFSPYTKWAAGIYLDEQFRQEELINSNLDISYQNFKYQSRDFWAGYSFPLFKGNTEKERTSNIITAFRWLDIDYEQKPGIGYDEIEFFSNEKFYLGSIGISSRQFIEDRYIFRDGITENVPIGDIYAITAGNQYKNNQNRFYLGAKMSHGNYFSWGYLSTNFEYGTFFNESKTEQTAFSISANYFTNLIPLGNQWRMRQFVKPQFIIGKNRLNSFGDRVSIDETNDFQDFYGNQNQIKNSIGIPGFNSELLGTSKYVLSLQTQFYTPWQILGFRFNPYVNINMAMLGDENITINPKKLYTSFGVGFIIRNDYLVFNSFQLSLTYYPIIPGEGNNIFNTNSLNTDDFGLQGFEFGKPSPIWYN